MQPFDFLERMFAELEVPGTTDLKELQRRLYGKYETSDDRVRLMRATLLLASAAREEDRGELATLCAVLQLLLRGRLELDEECVSQLLAFVVSFETPDPKSVPVAGVVDAVERCAGSNGLSAAWKESLATIKDRLSANDLKPTQSLRSLARRISELCDDSILSRLKPDDGWASLMVSEITMMAPERQRAWDPLLRHAATVHPEPPARSWDLERGEVDERAVIDDTYWQRYAELMLDRSCATAWAEQMRAHIAGIGEQEYRTRLLAWFEAVPNSKPGYLSRDSLNREILRGLLWSSVDFADPAFARAIGAACAFLFKKNSPLGVTGVRLLARIRAENTLNQLTVLAGRVKAASQKSLIQAARQRVAARSGLPIGDLDEIAIPSSGLTELGRRVETLSGFSAELVIVGDGVELRWQKPNGEPQKATPAKVKREHKSKVNELKGAMKEIKTTLSMVARRIEESPLARRRWSYADWRQRYFDHPVAGTVARRLFWVFSGSGMRAVGAADGDRIVSLTGAPVAITDDTVVTLWHPIDADPNEIVAWRRWLFDRETTQPFKQAHREVYLLTDAERETGTYSNRFAAHVLGQSQFRALAKSRGWQTGYLGPWDSGDHGIARLELPDWNMRAEFWLEGAGEEIAQAGGFLYVATDQLRFYQPRDAREPMPLTDVPTLVLSEVMRDVDLFVGVASVGNNPEWQDGGPGGCYRDYWHSYSLGVLSETARTRKAVLEHIVPRLKIADRCTFEGRFLVVRGDLRTYRIHLGSGHTFMEPNDQYLCIVPGRGAATQRQSEVFLPFEGDRTLSIILSKAFMLAEDVKITDSTIVNQIGKSR
ncbi:MAG TPA: DUF4132 domain-containing protein [Thermoguttaceae bacterium]|nr:DUF4132 domain-containing protein [Thermoguttaceae bacterium]